MNRYLLSASALLLAGCGGPEPAANGADAAAPVPAPTASSWAGLAGKVGAYPRDIGLFDTSAISGELKALLGDQFDTFKANMEVQGPLAEADGVLWTSGNKPHEGGREAAYLLIDPDARQIEVGLWHDGRLRTFASPGASIARPADVRALIDNAREAP